MKKRITFSVFAILALLVSLQVSAQTLGTAVKPLASADTNPIYYYLESAAVTSLGSPNATLTSILPLKDNKYVAYSQATTKTRVMYRISTGGEEELWSVELNANGKSYFKNKSTGFYLRGSREAGAYWVNDSVRFTSLGSDQYAIRTSVTEADNSTVVNNSYMIAWNSLTCDRWGSAQINTNTAWLFRLASGSEKNYLQALINDAQKIINTSVGDAIGQYSVSAGNDLQTAITAAQDVYNNSSASTTELLNAIAALNTAVSTFYATSVNLPVSATLGSDETLYAIYTPNRNNASLIDILPAGSNLKSQFNSPLPESFPNTQVWSFILLGDGTYALVNPFSGNYVTNTNATAGSGKISSTTTTPTAGAWKLDKASIFPLMIIYSPTLNNGQLNLSTTNNAEVNNWGYNQGTKNTEGFIINDAGSSFLIKKVGQRNTKATEPTASVPAGPVDEGTNISLTATNASDIIYYTLDGTDPKTSATRQNMTSGNSFVAPASGFTLQAYVEGTQTYFPSDILTNVYSITTGVGNSLSKNYNIQIIGGFITVEGADNFELYSVAGQKLNLNSTLQKGVYLIKIKDFTQKVVVK